MKRQKNRIKAFTIMELMVVAVLSIIVVSAALTAYRLLESEYFAYATSTAKSLDLQSLHRLLLEDALQAKAIQQKQQSINFQLPDYELAYYFTSRRIIRQPLLPDVRADTFAVGGLIKAAQLQDPATEGLINQLTIVLQSDGQEHRLLLDKKYSSEELMKHRTQ